MVARGCRRYGHARPLDGNQSETYQEAGRSAGNPEDCVLNDFSVAGNLNAITLGKRGNDLMKLATFTHKGSTRIGVVRNERIIDLSLTVPGLPTDMTAFLEAGESAIAAVRGSGSGQSAAIPLDEVHLEATVSRPRKFLGLGANYADKRDEMDSRAELKAKGYGAQDYQIWFNK